MGVFRSKASLFLDSVRTRQARMENAYALDPTPHLKEKIESHRKKLAELELMHERFEGLMATKDSELSINSSNERIAPLLGNRELVKKILRRLMGEEEYRELTEGPTLITKIQ